MIKYTVTDSRLNERGYELQMNKKKRRIGDRYDGRRLRTIEPYNAIIPYVMKTRNDSSNFFADSIEITEAERFLRNKRTSGYPSIGMLHLFVAAFIRVTARYPGVNRFVSGQKVFTREKVEFVTTVKTKLSTDAPETSIKVAFDKTDTIDDVYHKINEAVRRVKDMEGTNTDDVANTIMKMPGILIKFAIFFLGMLDYFGKFPKSLTAASPFHGSVTISDIGSIGLPVIYHHLYNFGNMPLFISFGAKRKVYEPDKTGEVHERKYIDFTLVMDERICDGFYFSQAYRELKKILKNPEVLETPPEKVVEDID